MSASSSSANSNTGARHAQRDRPTGFIRYVPNLLTTVRLCLLAPYLYFLFHGQFTAAAVTYLIAVITDLDGAIARKYNVTTRFGAIADPTVDAIFMTSGLISLCALGRVEAIPVAAYFVGALFRLVPSLSHLRQTETVQSTRVSKAIAFCGFSAVFLGTFGVLHLLTTALLLLGFGANVILTLFWMQSGRLVVPPPRHKRTTSTADAATGTVRPRRK